MKRPAVTFEDIIPACFAETILLQTLGYPCNKNHQMGDGNAIHTLSKIKTNKVVALMDRPIGIAPSHVPNDFRDIKTGNNNLVLKKHRRKNHYIIYIDKVLEEWIFEIASKNKIKSPYKSISALKTAIKPKSSLSNKSLLKYFKDINHKNPPAFKTISNWIKEL